VFGADATEFFIDFSGARSDKSAQDRPLCLNPPFRRSVPPNRLLLHRSYSRERAQDDITADTVRASANATAPRLRRNFTSGWRLCTGVMDATIFSWERVDLSRIDVIILMMAAFLTHASIASWIRQEVRPGPEPITRSVESDFVDVQSPKTSGRPAGSQRPSIETQISLSSLHCCTLRQR
jgi:hypothetical protein